MYADDVALVGRPDDMHRMLMVAELHSSLLGYRWNPSKCEVLNAPEATEFYLYDNPLPPCQSFRYLGLPFTRNGIDQDVLLRQSNTKAVEVMWNLRNSGVHMYGFGLPSAIRAYKIFVRPIIEYGIAICNLTTKQRMKLDETQNACLRLCLRRKPSGRVNTGPVAVLAGLPKMSARYAILQAKFAQRAYRLPSNTLLKAMMPTTGRHAHDPYNWAKIRANRLWRESVRLKDSENPPKDCLAH
ncbi:hypothetical protein DFQ29_003346, partial [Apophysomyces sp. BC1021]